MNIPQQVKISVEGEAGKPSLLQAARPPEVETKDLEDEDLPRFRYGQQENLMFQRNTMFYAERSSSNVTS